MTVAQLSLEDALRDRGMARVDAAEPAEWKERADRAIAELAASGQPFSADDVRDRAGDPERPNSMGSALNRAARRGLISMVGLQKSSRPGCHAHRNPVWQGGRG